MTTFLPGGTWTGSPMRQPRQELISDAYLSEQVFLHMQPRGYGAKGGKWHVSVRWIADQYGCGSVLDYGCGQGGLAVALNGSGLSVREYDPAIPEKSERPVFADLVACTDVLEHVELDKLPNVLNHIHALARKVVFLVVALDEANKILRDGRNAHLIQKPREWWMAKADEHGLHDVTPAALALPAHMGPEKLAKRWIAVLLPR